MSTLTERKTRKRDQPLEAGTRRGAYRRHLQLLTGMEDRGPLGEVVLAPVSRPRLARGEKSRPPIRVLLADAQALVRAGHRALLDSHADIEVVAEAANSEQAIALAAETAPDVALLDQALPGLDGPEATVAIASHPAFAKVAVMLLASGEPDERVLSALLAGAVGVLRKDDEPATLIESVRLLARGQALLPARVVRGLLGEFRPRPLHHAHLTHSVEELTDRECEVVALAAEGLTNSEIATRLVISQATAKTHVSRAMIKLHARHRAELVVFAYEVGLVPPELPAAL
jgi:DNA-binding NarL/FixJ family response regulator